MGYCDKINCGYWWKDDDEDFPHCHYEGPDGSAPCEIDDED